MRVFFINNLGGGFADHLDIADGMTVGELFDSKVGGDANGFLIRVNRLPTTRDQVLQESDRISITPVRIEGAQS